MTFSWLSHNFLINFSWIYYGFFMTFSCLPHDFCMNFSWLSLNFFLTLSWLSHYFIMTFLRLSINLLMTFSWFFFMNFSWLLMTSQNFWICLGLFRSGPCFVCIWLIQTTNYKLQTTLVIHVTVQFNSI